MWEIKIITLINQILIEIALSVLSKEITPKIKSSANITEMEIYVDEKYDQLQI